MLVFLTAGIVRGRGTVRLHTISQVINVTAIMAAGSHSQEQGPASYDALPEAELSRRRQLIVEATRHSWEGYVTYAWGADELAPLTNGSINDFGHMGATIVDSLDTLWLMGMKDEFNKAVDFVAQLDFDRNLSVSVFETTIRFVGGLLAAHELSGEPVLLQQCEKLVHRLMFAWDTPTGFPYGQLNLHTFQGGSGFGFGSMLAEFGTEQLEMLALSALTGNATFAHRVEHVIRVMNGTQSPLALKPLFLDPASGSFTSTAISLGAMGDSYYEYLLKAWLLKGKTDDMYRAMWEAAMDDMIACLLFETSPNRLKYIANFDHGYVAHRFEHLACFIPAMLALGAKEGAVNGSKAERYLSLAKDLTYTCWQMYDRHATGLAPEFVHWAWSMFEAFEKHCRVAAGYAGLRDVNLGGNDNTMQSFWIAETLKYAYLLHSPTDLLPLDQWVLNTEAHPIRVLNRQH
ncbi:hypothetical protein WJX73_006594 [Symbiochloris irregularis]|uniref:alpha-1,2-Mannosidase n=1 Tax=Symbiochloris irregularis TaxID=706552 RepID=A0AAW1NQK8_9CHLO